MHAGHASSASTFLRLFRRREFSMSARNDLAQLLIPVLRSTPGRGFSEERPRIDEALAAGVGGFQLIGGEQDVVRALAKELQLKSRHPLLIAAELERGAGAAVSWRHGASTAGGHRGAW